MKGEAGWRPLWRARLNWGFLTFQEIQCLTCLTLTGRLNSGRSRHFVLVSFPRELGIPLSTVLAGTIPHKITFPYSLETSSFPPFSERSRWLGGPALERLQRPSRGCLARGAYSWALEEPDSIWELRRRRWGWRTLTFCRPEPCQGELHR